MSLQVAVKGRNTQRTAKRCPTNSNSPTPGTITAKAYRELAKLPPALGISLAWTYFTCTSIHPQYYTCSTDEEAEAQRVKNSLTITWLSEWWRPSLGGASLLNQNLLEAGVWASS